MEYRFNNVQILAIGDIVLDRYILGGIHRTSPEAPVPVVDIETVEERPGCVGNVAMNIASLAAHCHLLALVGDDREGASITHLLEQQSGISPHLQLCSKETIVKTRVVSQQQQLIRMDRNVDFTDVDKQALLQTYQRIMPKMQAVLVSDYGKGIGSDMLRIIALAHAQQKPIFIDPQGHDFSHYRGATALLPNFTEFQGAVGSCDTEEMIQEKGQALIKTLQLQALLITRGEEGMTLLVKDEDAVMIPTSNKDVYDVTGASDTVIASFATAFAAGYTMKIAAQIANNAASIVVTKLGTATVTAKELQGAAEKQCQKISKGIVNLQQLKLAVQRAKSAGETVVMTNGCFDLMHAGHVAYLQEAKKLGDRLIVAINEDASIRRIKGECRPIQNFKTRCQLLAALSAVDWVVGFCEDTPENLLRTLQPDILVKGGDYNTSEIVGGDIVLQYGGRIDIIKHGFADCTTSSVIEKIKVAEH